MTYTPEEQKILANYFSNINGRVFALKNLPEHTKGALFARYSRSNKSLRRLFLDEFYKGQQCATNTDVGDTRASELYNKVFLGYGDDSVAQLGGAHIAVEGVSQICIKLIQRSRLMSFLEQSTRYVPYGVDQVYRSHGLGACVDATMRSCMNAYQSVLKEMTTVFTNSGGERGARAKALDVARGLLPAAATSNVGVYGSGQAYETLLHRLFASELPEANDVARLMLAELNKVIPSFVKRVPLADRGQRTVRYISGRDAVCRRASQVLFNGAKGVQTPTVCLLEFDRQGEAKVLEAILYEQSMVPASRIARRVSVMSEAAQAKLFDDYQGVRANRRHKPGRAFEEANYTFELTTSYGAFRDLQRHRLCTVTWQRLGTELGYTLPPELASQPELQEVYKEAMKQAADIHSQLPDSLEAQYVVPLAFKIRYRININARALCHMLELRTQPGGHREYIDVCREMHHQLVSVAGHQHIARAMSFVDHGDSQ